jgi:hypothetical protein
VDALVEISRKERERLEKLQGQAVDVDENARGFEEVG